MSLPPPSAGAVRPAAREALRTACWVTLAVTALAAVGPEEWSSTLVGGLFFVTTYWLVFRGSDEQLRASGVSFAGLLESAPLHPPRVLRGLGIAALWCLACCVVFFPLYWLAYVQWFEPERTFVFSWGEAPLDAVAAQVFAVALPEELFYRGYLQSRLERAWGTSYKFLGAQVGYGLLVSSLIFAAGHFTTTLNWGRWSVFLPSLLFAWLRARTGSIGAGVLFHAACNLFSESLARGYGYID